MATTDKKYLNNSGLIKTLEILNEEFNGIPLKRLLDATKSAGGLFVGCNGTSVNDLIKYDDTSNVTDMYSMFENCGSLTSIPLFDTNNVTSMSRMFYNCPNLTTIPLLTTSKVTNMSSMFDGCNNLTTIPSLNTSNVTNMNYMFDYCSNLIKISMLNIGTDLDVHYCTKMGREALLEVLGNLKDLTGQASKRLTLGSTLLTKLTDDDKAIATNKNWTLA